MAEGFLKKYAGERFEAMSAGLEPKELHPLTKKVMEEIGIDMRDHSAKPLSDFMGKAHFGYLITVCENAEKRCASAFPGMGKRIHVPFEDPAAFDGTEEEKTEKFREIRDQIDNWIRSWLDDQGFGNTGSVNSS
jgi:arsenate reductase